MARVLVAALVAMIISILAGPKFIEYLRRNEFGQHIRAEGPQRHLAKQGTPTMGGLLIILAAAIAFLATSDYTWVSPRTTSSSAPTSSCRSSTTGSRSAGRGTSCCSSSSRAP
jgi:UDP-N-acetylmuramyl pentapeptide phosphotransferase/UDP-N-acetylglucosamine-1-phosphate transferase